MICADSLNFPNGDRGIFSSFRVADHVKVHNIARRYFLSVENIRHVEEKVSLATFKRKRKFFLQKENKRCS